MISSRRFPIYAPSEWDVVFSPELAPLFVLDAAIVAAHRFFSIELDPSSSAPRGAKHPPTRALLDAMRTLRGHIRKHTILGEGFTDYVGGEYDEIEDVPQPDSENIPS